MTNLARRSKYCFALSPGLVYPCRDFSYTLNKYNARAETTPKFHCLQKTHASIMRLPRERRESWMPSPLRLIKPEIPTSTMLPDSPSLAPLPKPLLDSCPLEQQLQN